MNKKTKTTNPYWEKFDKGENYQCTAVEWDTLRGFQALRWDALKILERVDKIEAEIRTLRRDPYALAEGEDEE